MGQYFKLLYLRGCNPPEDKDKTAEAILGF